MERVSKGGGELLLVNRPLPTKGWVVTDRGQENSTLLRSRLMELEKNRNRHLSDALGKGKLLRRQSPRVVPIGVSRRKQEGRTSRRRQFSDEQVSRPCAFGNRSPVRGVSSHTEIQGGR